VTFDIDANGIVKVSAKDKATGKEHQIQIKASGGLSDEDIEKMVKDAEANADSDKKKIEAIEARNNADSIVHSTEKSVKEHGSKIPKEDKEKIEKSLEALKEVLKDEKSETSIIKEKTDALIQDSMKLGEIIYKEAQEKAENEKAEKEKSGAKAKTDKEANKSSKKKDEKVVDADFEDVTEKKDSDKDNEKSA
jgi:molecular chaperone DnaK